MYRKCRRDKVLVIAFARNGDRLYVQDKTTKEWCYISGGCKGPDYDPVSNAHREFNEETSNCLKLELDKRRYNYIKTVRTTYRPSELIKKDRESNKEIISYYHIFSVHLTDFERTLLTKGFTANDEISSIQFSSKLNKHEKQWELMSHLKLM